MKEPLPIHTAGEGFAHEGYLDRNNRCTIAMHPNVKGVYLLFLGAFFHEYVAIFQIVTNKL